MKSAGYSPSSSFSHSLDCFALQGDGYFPSSFSLLLPEALNIWRLKQRVNFQGKRMLECVKYVRKKGIWQRCLCLFGGILQMVVAEATP